MKDKKIIKNRGFGILFFIVFLILAFWPVKNNGEVNIYLLFIATVFLILGIFNSKILSPLNRAWIKFGTFLGIFISPIVMAIVYFFVLTPISLMLRLFRKDILGLKFNHQVTYWVKRRSNIGTMKNQF